MIHPLAAHFGSAADVYERGRPEYPPAVTMPLLAELALSPGAHVLDLGAGTGKLTRALAAAGLEVTAVEPQAEMRERLRAGTPGVKALAGAAERIPLGDAAVAAVTVADAFHWFDAPAALAEIRRVLAPGGGLAVVNALPDWSALPAADELGRLLSELRPEHPFFDGPAWAEQVRAEAGWTEPRDLSIAVSQPTSVEQLVAYIASISFVAMLHSEPRAALLGRAAELLDATGVPAELTLRFRIGLTTRG